NQQRAVFQLRVSRDQRPGSIAGAVVPTAGDEHQGVRRLWLLREVAREPDEHGEAARVVVAALKVAVRVRIDDDPFRGPTWNRRHTVRGSQSVLLLRREAHTHLQL